MNYEERRLKIVMWTVVALLILSIAGASLLFIMKLRTPSTRLNTVNIGSRITGGGASKAPGGLTYDTAWVGSGTEADPYLITTLSEFYGLKVRVNSGETFAGKYIKLDSDISFDGDADTFSSLAKFSGNFDGGGHTIDNITKRLFENISPANDSTNITIKNLNINCLPHANFDGGNLFGKISSNYTATVTIDNVHINAPNCMARCNNVLTQAVKNYSAFCTVDKDAFTTINNCSIRGLTMEAYGSSGNTTSTQYMSGFVGVEYKYICQPRLTITNCYTDTDIKVTKNLSNSVYVAGFTAFCSDGYLTMDSCLYDGDIYTTSAKVKGVYLFSMGARSLYSKSISNILVQGNAYVENNSSYNTVYFGIAGSKIVLNSTIDTKSPTTATTYTPFSRADASYDWANCVFNRDKITNRNTNATMDSFGATTDEDMKLRSTYADWTDFDGHWIIDPNINNGYPMLRAFVDVAKVTGFDGSGTETDPYLIKTQQDLLGMASYYNDNAVFGQNNIYWKLANDIDVSRDANNALIHFTPICYNKSFDGYFDGNNKTISGLLIDNQYEYTGLFGTIASNHWVKNLIVKGNIYWDEAYAVGGVAGRVLAGGYLQDCHFEGNIIGVLNTKPSTENNGVVGKFEINGAIDCTATYTDLKYAKIGGTAESPTYTYYLYDWAQMTTYLYNKKVA